MLTHVEVKSELDLGEPSKELLCWAEENIREDPNTRCQILDDFREMIYSRGECTPVRVDDSFLLRFLRSRKFVLESAYKLFLNYHDLRDENPTYINSVGFELLEKIGDNDLIIVPPYRDQTGKRILLYKLGNWIPESVTIDEVLAATQLILELAILEERAQILGGICIIDCENITMQHALHMTPTVARKVVQVAVTSHPMRLEAMHIVNNSWAFEMFFNFFKPLLRGKMMERLYFHGTDMESLHKHVDPKNLPQKYGGYQPFYDYRDWIRGFRKDKTIIEELKSLGYKV
ncbi:alpha-tocopherol transfer protein-like [Tribolium madens]|uniref:alpha-tocopherol transfer protein-like n=1 Tax=Tribolium madens TaxID=41895 RepID=UPI001CF74646|nr:alpha-tocopherol transfer protein-like [Tribolium madens]